MEWSNLGSATHYSIPGWIISCEKRNCQCVHYAWVYWIVCAACSGLGDTHQPIRLETAYLWVYQQLRFTGHKPTSTSIFAFVGDLSKCSFSIGFFKAAHIVSEFYLNSLWVQQWYVFWENFRASYKDIRKTYGYQSNAESFNHLALLTMLSALRHGWGI